MYVHWQLLASHGVGYLHIISAFHRYKIKSTNVFILPPFLWHANFFFLSFLYYSFALQLIILFAVHNLHRVNDCFMPKWEQENTYYTNIYWTISSTHKLSVIRDICIVLCFYFIHRSYCLLRTQVVQFFHLSELHVNLHADAAVFLAHTSLLVGAIVIVLHLSFYHSIRQQLLKVIVCAHAMMDFDESWTQWLLNDGPSELVRDFGSKVI